MYFIFLETRIIESCRW